MELSESQVQAFKAVRAALGHSESTQTFAKMLQLIHAAIALTSKENPGVTLYTRDPALMPNTLVTCPHCGKQFYPQARLESDGFRELSVDLS
jgi:hypothetical protein